MSSDILRQFDYNGQPVRTTELNGQPAIVLSDIAKVLGYAKASDAARLLRDHHKGYAKVRTLGGDQQMLVVTEHGFNRLVIRSNASNAEEVQDWITDEVMPSIVHTGGYGTPDLTSPRGVLALAEQYQRAAIELVQATERAEKAEGVVASIESKAGITLTEFHKHYFSDVGARQFFEAMYRLDLLIDQRGTRGRDDKGRLKNGHQHRHPTAKGKQYLYLHGGLDTSGIRRESVRVRPGTPETDLRDFLAGHGLTPNRNEAGTTKEIAA